MMNTNGLYCFQRLQVLNFLQYFRLQDRVRITLNLTFCLQTFSAALHSLGSLKGEKTGGFLTLSTDLNAEAVFVSENAAEIISSLHLTTAVNGILALTDF